MLKRVAVIILAVVMLFSLAACNSGGGSQPASTGSPPASSGGGDNQDTAPAPADPIEWNLGAVFADPAATDAYTNGIFMKTFSELVAERSQGQLIVNCYYSSVLGSQPEMFDQVRRGEQNAFFGQAMASADSRFGVFSVPYTFRDINQVKQLIASPGAPLFQLAQGWMEENNAVLVATGQGVFRDIFNSKHAVQSVDDVRDLKLRIYEDPVVHTFWDNLCNATVMPVSEIYSGLQTKVIDGLEFESTALVSEGFAEIVTYFSDINWQWVWNWNLIVSKSDWDALTPELQAIVTDCAYEALDVLAVSSDEYRKSIDQVLADEHGIEVYKLTDAERQTWIDYAATLKDDFRDVIGADTFDSVQAIVGGN